MREPVDILVDAAVSAVQASGAIESVARMGTVSMVRTGAEAGTIDVDLEGGTVHLVRMLSGYYAPVVGDVVEVMRTANGWVCLGRLDTPSQPPQIQSGTTSMTTPENTWATANVVFPRPFSAPPRVVLTPVVTAVQTFYSSIDNPTATGFTARVYRTGSSTTTVHWIATSA